LWAIIGGIGDWSVKPPLAPAEFAAYMLYYQFLTSLYQGKATHGPLPPNSAVNPLPAHTKFRCRATL
jgi:hypothetical protein